jgi:hypothetical protein
LLYKPDNNILVNVVDELIEIHKKLIRYLQNLTEIPPQQEDIEMKRPEVVNLDVDEEMKNTEIEPQLTEEDKWNLDTNKCPMCPSIFTTRGG